MQGNKRYIIFIVLVSIILGCSSTYKFKPQKDEYQYFFGIKLPVLSDNKKQFIVTDKMKKAIKTVKDYNWEEYHNNEIIKRKFFIGDENSFYDYRENKEIHYGFSNEHKDNSVSIGFYKLSPYIKILNKKVWLYISNSFNYYPNSKIRYFRSNMYSTITNDCSLEYGKECNFSENGEVLFEIDYEKNFSMKLTKVFELASPYISEIKDSTSIIDVTRKFDQNSGYWVIQNWEASEIEVSDSLGVHKGTNYNLVIIDDKTQKVIAGKKFIPLKQLQKTIDINVMIKEYNSQYNKDYLTDLYKKRRKIVDSLDSVLKNKKW